MEACTRAVAVPQVLELLELARWRMRNGPVAIAVLLEPLMISPLLVERWQFEGAYVLRLLGRRMDQESLAVLHAGLEAAADQGESMMAVLTEFCHHVGAHWLDASVLARLPPCPFCASPTEE